MYQQTGKNNRLFSPPPILVIKDGSRPALGTGPEVGSLLVVHKWTHGFWKPFDSVYSNWKPMNPTTQALHFRNQFRGRNTHCAQRWIWGCSLQIFIIVETQEVTEMTINMEMVKQTLISPRWEMSIGLKVRLISAVDMERSQTLLGEQRGSQRVRCYAIYAKNNTRRKPLYAYNCLCA